MDVAKNSCFASSVITDQTLEDVPEEEDCPYEMTHIWDWYTDINSFRLNGMGVGPILPTEIEAWGRLMKYDLIPIEVKGLLEIDKAFQIHANTDKKDKNGKHP